MQKKKTNIYILLPRKAIKKVFVQKKNRKHTKFYNSVKVSEKIYPQKEECVWKPATETSPPQKPKKENSKTSDKIIH